MKQLVQNLSDGKMELMEVPVPSADRGTIVVQTLFSAISAGTESSKVTTARANLFEKARKKPVQVKQVVDSMQTEGFFPTLVKVLNKLDSPSPLGYSCTGKVIAIGEGVDGFQIGDIVACGGESANHAEFTKNPKNLCVKVPAGIPVEFTAFTTIGAIALQGIRQADLRLGENCAVIGLGLIGQLTVQMLKAAGIKVACVDIDKEMVIMARNSGADLSLMRVDTGTEKKIMDFSDGKGVDAVIITAGTSSNDPIELAGTLCRQKGKVVIVGAVPTGFSRENYYKKELDLRMSCSYGPGRYDPEYEEKGRDYPIGYIRWTENRNMQAFLTMLAQKKIDLSLLITHRYAFQEVKKAYDMIIDNKETFIGILLNYDSPETGDSKKILLRSFQTYKKDNANIGFIGVGSFAQKYLLPNVYKRCNLVGVYDGIIYNSKHIAQKYGFNYATSDFTEVTNDPSLNTVFIASRHNEHASQVLDALRHDKNVFVEKPLCLMQDELEAITAEYLQRNVRLMVGFNRRFSPFIQLIKKKLTPNIPISINYRVNAGSIPSDSWFQDKEVGGGRIVGEVCHFIDLCCFITDSKVKRIFATATPDPNHNFDTLVVNLAFEKGSIASISYFANGSRKLKKEYLEVFSSGLVYAIDDFSRMKVYDGKTAKEKSTSQDKGHKNEILEFLKSLIEGNPAPISFEEIHHVTMVTFKVIESIKEQNQVVIL